MLETRDVSIICPECGGKSFERPIDLQENDFVKCTHCNFEILFGDLKQINFDQIKQQAIQEIQKNLVKKFGRNFKKR